MTQPLRVLLVDDHVLYRSGLASLMASRPAFELVGEAGNGFQAIDMARILEPDVVVMDLHMPDCSGLEATRAIKKEMPWVNIVMLSVSDEDEYLFEALKSGARGYLLKILEPANLFETLCALCRGEAALTRQMAARVLRELGRRSHTGLQNKPDSHSLTPRETKVLELLAVGTSNREIAQRLGLTEKEVQEHLRGVLDKLHDEALIRAR